jgi:hypothetical protein
VLGRNELAFGFQPDGLVTVFRATLLHPHIVGAAGDGFMERRGGNRSAGGAGLIMVLAGIVVRVMMVISHGNIGVVYGWSE